MSEPLDRERIYDIFNLTAEERAWIETDASGWQAAREAADAQYAAFVRHLEEVTKLTMRDIEERLRKDEPTP